MREYFRKPYMTQGITKHEDYMKAIPQRAIDVQGLIAPNIEFKKPYDYHPNSPQMIHYYANNLNYLGGDPVPPLNDPSLLPHAPVIPTVETVVTSLEASPLVNADDGFWATDGSVFGVNTVSVLDYTTFDYQCFVRFPNILIKRDMVIRSALVTFTAASPSASCVSNCYFNNVDSAIAPTSVGTAEAKTLTTVTPWTSSAWVQEATNKTPNLKVSLQEVIHRAGWQSGNAIMLIVKATTGGGSFTAYDFNAGSGYAKIKIEYEVIT